MDKSIEDLDEQNDTNQSSWKNLEATRECWPHMLEVSNNQNFCLLEFKLFAKKMPNACFLFFPFQNLQYYMRHNVLFYGFIQ